MINRTPSQASRCRHGNVSPLSSLRYVLVLAGVDALIGGVAAAIPASLSDTLYAYQAVPLLCVIGLLFWPAAIAVSRGYRRARIGVGSDEFRAVLLAGSVMVVACALPAGFLVIRNEALSPDLGMASPLFALLSAVVVGTPIAVVLSLTSSCLCPEAAAPTAAAGPKHPARDRGWQLCGGPAAHRADRAGAARGNEDHWSLPAVRGAAATGRRRNSGSRQPRSGGRCGTRARLRCGRGDQR